MIRQTKILFIHIFNALLLLIANSSNLVQAQNYQVLPQPACFKVINKDTQKVFGKIETAPIPGEAYGHQRNFRLEVDEFVEVCTKGPLYPGYRVLLEINSLFPLFECYTSITQNIVIQRTKTSNDDYLKTPRGQTKWAECY